METSLLGSMSTKIDNALENLLRTAPDLEMVQIGFKGFSPL